MEKLPVVEVVLFGTFTLRCGPNVLSDDMDRARRPWNLLAFLLLGRGREYSADMLHAMCCDGARSASPADVLKNLIYRVRRMLGGAGFPPDCVISSGGRYIWNPNVPCRLDVEQFERHVRTAQDEEAPEEARIAQYRQALALYRGTLLPRAATEEWVVPRAVYYRTLYIRSVFELCGLLSARREYELQVDVCRRALQLDPDDEAIYILMIRALVALSRSREALQAYETITERLYGELAVDPSDELRALYREITDGAQNAQTDMLTIQRDLDEAARRQGAFLCNYEIFKNMYRFLARNVVRSGQSVLVALFTLTQEDGGMPPGKTLARSMDALQGVLLSSLRQGDVVARFSRGQFVVLLCGLSHENGMTVLGRVTRAFYAAHRRGSVFVRTKLRALEPYETGGESI